MKKLSSIILSLFILSCGDTDIVKPPSTVQHGWVVQAPELGINQFYDVTFTDNNNGWIVGSHGKILHTSNGGVSWNEQESNTTESLTKVFFLNNNLGWTCNLDGSIYYTTDGGNLWELQFNEYKLGLYNIFFSDEKHGWAVGRGHIDDSANFGAVVIATTDGGATWFDLIRDNQIGGQITGVYFLDSLKGWIAGGFIRGTFRTEDGGHTWQPLETLSGSLSDLIFFNDTVGISYALTAAVLKTYDSGISWKYLPVITNGRWLFDMEFVGDQLGWLVGEKGYINHTTDGGDSWNQQVSGTNNLLRAVSFSSPNNGWAVGKGATIIHTTDGGTNWNSEVKPTEKALADIKMINKSVGCAIGADGTILRTIDGGNKWETVAQTDSAWFYALSTPSENSLYAVGDSSKVIKSIDQGVNWFSVAPNYAVNYRDVFFLDDNNGWIVGNNYIFKTMDGGNNWQIDSLSILSFSFLSSVYFIDSVNGWITTKYGTIFNTTNGGMSWTEQFNIQEGFTFNDIYFRTNQHGFVIGNSFSYFETKDGGVTWEFRFLSPNRVDSYNSIHFTDSLNGWIVGEDFIGLYGVIYKTTDGGATWELITKAVENPLYSVFFLDNKLGWICGENGTILHTTDGGSEF